MYGFIVVKNLWLSKSQYKCVFKMAKSLKWGIHTEMHLNTFIGVGVGLILCLTYAEEKITFKNLLTLSEIQCDI